jgi:glutaredoxin 3
MNIQIYSQPGCSGCEQAKNWMKSKGIEYQELILNVGQPQLPNKTYVPVQHLKDRVPNAKSVPQIFDGKHHIGGFAELQKWYK